MFGNEGMQFTPQDWQQMALTAGLSMLGNNNGTRSVGQLIGKGGLDALAGLQARKQYEAAIARQQMQDEQARQLHDMRMQRGQMQMDEATRRADMMQRWMNGDQSVYKYLFPLQYLQDQRQARDHAHALKVAAMNEAKNGTVFSPVPQTPPTVFSTIPAQPTNNAGPSMTPGKVYDFDGNEMQGNGSVKWGKREEIMLPDGRKVIGQLDPSGNVFRYGGDVEGKRLPLSAVNNITGNSSMLGRIRNAGEEARKNPDATGPIKGFANDWLPDAVLQFFDSDGTVSRAKIAELGSQVIHDRSGAAVTASEFPRLKPFIPQIGDTPDTVQKKLKQFYAIVQEEHLLYLEALKESGYSVPENFVARGMKPFDDLPELPEGFKVVQ